MKRNVYLILITVITILCIIAGTGYHLVRFGLSVAEGLPFFSEFIEAISDWDDDDDDSDDNDDSDNGISTSVDASQKNLDAFSSINADLNVVDLTIQRGNTFSITCLYLIWSFLSFDWWITWIVWPIAAIVESLIKNISKN